MRKLATTDALTNIANRRHIMDIGNREFTRARRYTHSLSVLMLDIDKFKFINDRWGHPVGDRVIKELANLLTITARDQDVSGRLGGEEFTVILPHTDTSGAKIIAERLRVVVAEAQGVNLDDNTIVRFTASIGIATLNVEDTSFDMLLQRADRALYKAKENGRNRVESDN
ncbi:GGDEF domain-containing protein [Undibacterium sp. CY21W]|uniref:GGDEF domain-containing protein n=1 Tax=Undibacterium sp. CY21W TaxID=2762293 RepID=UPI00164B507F|nr:GGDEF domain-containing protein [Undibacterium sp. CY21W]MBC3928326.1 GGDEF domain-containing protein [Undibacterium sp. CY21W]